MGMGGGADSSMAAVGSKGCWLAVGSGGWSPWAASAGGKGSSVPGVGGRLPAITSRLSQLRPKTNNKGIAKDL